MALSDDINSKNLIRGLGFREITLAQKEEDLNDSLSTEKHSFLKKLIWRLNAFLVNLSEKSVVVDFIVELLDPQEKELVCDPCCGSGGFLIKAFEHKPIHNPLSKQFHKVID